jgi:3-phosphoshikimate 1-carboxyvinyltransferase
VTGETVEVVVPGDKSISHRAMILAGLASGESRLAGLLDAGDTRSTARALRALGVDIPDPDPDDVTRVTGRGVHGLRRPTGRLDCGNSGTTARLLLGALAGCPFDAIVAGDASLSRRPMRRVTDALEPAGAAFDELEPPATLPVRVRGHRPLDPVRWRSPVASAQVKSALLLAGITGAAPVDVREPGPSRDHTERMLRAMGAPVTITAEGTERRIVLEPVTSLASLDVEVPGDFSAAAFFLAWAAVAGRVRVPCVGLNPRRTGALDVLRRMGADVVVMNDRSVAGEPRGDVEVSNRPLRGTTVAAEEIPALLDEVPVLAVIAAFADGETRFQGVGELRVKESDRVAALSENLRRLGVETEAGPEHLAVLGPARFRDGRIETYGDHRIAMAFGVLRAITGRRVEIDDERVVDISFPGFWKRLGSIGKERQTR